MKIILLLVISCFAAEIGIGLPARQEQIVSHEAYEFKYEESYEQASWIAYRLTYWRVVTDTFKRSNNFRSDPLVLTGSATKSDYYKSGYDRGHLCPAADMAWSKKVMSESFYLSNVSPQTPGFNRGVWKKLESQVREWAKTHDELFIVTGPVLKEGLKTIGNNVAIPELYYKVLLDTLPLAAIGFLLKHESSSADLKTFTVPIDSIEVLTGIDFYPTIKSDIESMVDWEWFK